MATFNNSTNVLENQHDTIELKALEKISQIFGQPVIPLCVPDGDGGCRVLGHGHGPDCPSPGKIPLVKGWQAPDWKLTPAAMSKYIRMGANWGMRLGGGVVELDFDDPAKYIDFLKNHTFPKDTPIMKTGRKDGGHKIILKSLKQPPKNFIHDGFEVRSRGLLVIPDSLHKSGNRYRWLSINGHIPEVDLEELLGVNFDDIQGPKQSSENRPLTTKQQQAAEEVLLEYLPGARNINGELAGYLDPDSISKAHIKVNIEKGVYMDWRKDEGGTIKDLLRRIGAPIPSELGGMGENHIPEYFPIWAIDRQWRKNWHCGQLVVVARYDGVPTWSGKAFCMTWGCPECSVRLKNILKARLKPLPALEVWKAPLGGAEKLSQIRRANKAFHYARALNRDSEYVLVRGEDYMNVELLANGFVFTKLKPNDVIDGLPHAPVGRRQKRFIPSRNFWDVVINNTTLPAESSTINSDKDAPETDMADMEAALGKEEMEKKDFDIVVLDDNYNDVLGRLEALGFQAKDTGEGESHRLRYPGGSEPPQVAPEELGEVVEVISLTDALRYKVTMVTVKQHY